MMTPRARAAQRAVPPRARLLLLVALSLLQPASRDAFRILDPLAGAANATASSSNAPAYFVAYAPGFVGRVQDPDNPRRFRVNPGSQFSLAQPNIFRGVLPRQDCPGMVAVETTATATAGTAGGAAAAGRSAGGTLFYCSRAEAGYCDRRSGACFCFEGYQGVSCEACRP
jgi:hypothetical protein